MLPIVDLSAQAGRTGHRLRVTEAKRLRMDARHVLGNSREDPPNVAELLRAAALLGKLLHDATEGECTIAVSSRHCEPLHPGVLLSTLRSQP
jgi:hypothetical protein